MLPFNEHGYLYFDTSTNNMKLEIIYVLCDELRSRLTIKPPPMFAGMFYTHTIQILDFDTKIELNTFFTFVAVVME